MLKILMHLFVLIILINNSMHTMCMDTAPVALTGKNYFEAIGFTCIVQTKEARSILTDSIFKQNMTPELKRLSIVNYIEDILILSPIIKDTNHPVHMDAYKCVQTLLAASELHYQQDAAAPVKMLIIKTIEEQNTLLMNLLFSGKSPLLNNVFTRFLDRDQNTALHLCIQHNFPEGITGICAHSELKYLEDTNLAGDTPLAYALKMNRPECVKILVNNHCVMDQKLTLDLANAHCSTIAPFLNDAQRPMIHLIPPEVLKNIWRLSAVGQDITSRIKSIDFSSVSKQFLACKVLSYPIETYPTLSSKTIDLALASLDTNEIKKIMWKILEKPWHQLNETEQKTVKEIITLHKSEELMNTGLDRAPMRSEGPTLLEYALHEDPNNIIDLSLVQFFVENGAQVNKKGLTTDAYKNLTPFEWILLKLTAENKKRLCWVWHNDLECAQYLLAKGGVVNEYIETKDGPLPEAQMPILFAVMDNGCSDIALKIILSQKNINKNIVADYDRTSHTPLSFAVHGHQNHRYGSDWYFSTINTLLATPEVDINQKTRANDTAVDVVDWAAHEFLTPELKNKARALLNAERYFPHQQPIDTTIQSELNPIPVISAANQPPHANVQLDAPLIQNRAPANPQVVGTAPAPVPGDNRAAIDEYFLGKKSLLYITGAFLCVATAYWLYKYLRPNEQEDEDEQDDEGIQEIDQSHCQ